ncbi:MAG: methylenetetrahydrofolate reductase [Runella sp.]
MFTEKIKVKKSGILLYGITPPKSHTEPEKVVEIAEKTLARLYDLDIDALVVYDVQDESARTTEERPFPFITALDPLIFAKNHLHSLNIPKIIYRPAGKYTPDQLDEWLAEVVAHGFSPVFVGVPSPDFKPLTSLNKAYNIWRKYEKESVIGAITIPERHAVLHDEDKRMLDKMNHGVSYFVSQCVFNVDYTKAMIEDLELSCAEEQKPLPTIIFTITTCGSKKTLQFMEWLGIHIPEASKETLLEAESMLEKSVALSLQIASELMEYCIEKQVPFGFNIESVAIRKDEIEASIHLVKTIGEMLRAKGLR